MKKVIPGFSRYSISKRGKIIDNKTGFLRKPHFNINTGRLQISGLFSDSGKVCTMQLSKLVALAWVPNPHNLPYVLHKDDQKLNNYYKNLYWGTQSMNMQDKVKNGWVGQIGFLNGITKLSVDDCRKILRLRAKGKTLKIIGSLMGVSAKTISRVVHNKTHHSKIASN